MTFLYWYSLFILYLIIFLFFFTACLWTQLPFLTTQSSLGNATWKFHSVMSSSISLFTFFSPSRIQLLIYSSLSYVKLGGRRPKSRGTVKSIFFSLIIIWRQEQYTYIIKVRGVQIKEPVNNYIHTGIRIFYAKLLWEKKSWLYSPLAWHKNLGRKLEVDDDKAW